MIENIQYKFAENKELCQMVNCLLDVYIYKETGDLEEQYIAQSNGFNPEN